MKIAITGISGFLGQSLKKYIQQSHPEIEILGIGRTPSGDVISYEEWLKSDLNMDAVIHLAGKAHDTKNTSKSEEYNQANTYLTQQIYDKFLASDRAKTFVFVSSIKAVADDSRGGIIDEETEVNPTTPYGISKRKAEQYLEEHFENRGKRTLIFRPSMVYGKGNKGNLNLLFNFVKKGYPYPLALFHNRRSLLYIENFNFVIFQSLISESFVSGIYNICNDTPISTKSIYLNMCKALETKPMLLPIPRFVIVFFCHLFDFVGFPMGRETLNKLVGNFEISNTKLLQALNCPLPVDTEEGLVKTFSDLKRND